MTDKRKKPGVVPGFLEKCVRDATDAFVPLFGDDAQFGTRSKVLSVV